ncbi:adenosylmethionine--8-amino-7-oxononanoate transaminase [Helicobacter sp. T3_23-1056]
MPQIFPPKIPPKNLQKHLPKRLQKSAVKNDKQARLKALDLAHIWHPCTQMKDHFSISQNDENLQNDENIPLIPIKKAKGVYLYDFNGQKYIDCVSSWWVNLFGHQNKTINKAIKKQLKTLEHIILAGFSHEQIIRFSHRLTSLLSAPLNKCFYADNGSSAIEVALKMSYQYHKNITQNLAKNHALDSKNHKPKSTKKRTKFLTLSNAYHGETLGALSVGDVGLYKDIYKPLLLECITTPVPKFTDSINDFATTKNAKSKSTKSKLAKSTNPIHSSNYQQELRALEKILQKEGENICAFILEPLIQCAGGINIYSKGFIKSACKLAKKYGILIIFDEIAVGFGRSGSMFAYEQCGVVPDFLCLSKGISGGYLPLSVVVTSDKIYEAFYGDSDSNVGFLHSHSYTGNALACAAANAVLDIFASQKIIEKNQTLSEFIASLWGNLSSLKNVANLRHCGMIFALDIVGSRHKRAGLEVFKKGLKRGLLLRPLANTIYFMPPFIITKKQVKFVVENLREILQNLG